MADVEVASTTTPLVDIDILSLIKDAQNQHGLRHGDFQRYRQYCTRKIQRLRKNNDFVNAKGKKYVFKPVTADTAKKLEHLLIVLFEAERAWSYAMQLKREVSEEQRKKHHLVKRLHKAAEHAKILETICSGTALCSPRSTLDAQAYASYMQGIFSFEKQAWQAAFDSLVKSRKIYANLAVAGTAQQEALCNARVEEIDPSIRYCAYNLGQLRGGESERELAELIALHGDSSGMEMLSDKLGALLIEGKKSETFTEVEFLGKKLPLRSAKLRDALLTAQGLQAEIAAQPTAGGRTDEDLLALYDKLLQMYGDAADMAKEDVRLDEAATAKAKSQKGAENSAILRQILSHVISLRLMQVIRRNVILIQGVIKRLPDENTATKQGDKPAKFEDVIHLYDALVQNWNELKSLEGATTDEAFNKLADGNVSLYRGLKCLYGARVLEDVIRWADANSLLVRAQSHAAAAEKSLQQASAISAPSFAALFPAASVAETLAQAQSLVEKVHAGQSYVKASAVLTEQQELMAKAADNKAPLSTRLDDLLLPETVDVQHLNLVEFPPRFQAVPAKPVFFDLAENYIELPSIAGRKDARSSVVQGLTGFISSFWGGADTASGGKKK